MADWPGYEVSTEGRIKSLQRRMTRSNGRPHTTPQRILKLATDTNGYHQFKAYPDKIPVLVHREVYKAFRGDIPEKHQVDHMDSNPLNNTVDNLQALSDIEHKRISRQRRVEAAFWAGVEWHKQHLKEIANVGR
jgi:hypothetical protein